MRLIDADLFIKHMRDYCDADDATKKIIDTLSYITNVEAEFHSVDAVSVIRCKDCKHYLLGHDDTFYCFKHDDDILWQDDSFCSFAERKK